MALKHVKDKVEIQPTTKVSQFVDRTCQKQCGKLGNTFITIEELMQVHAGLVTV